MAKKSSNGNGLWGRIRGYAALVTLAILIIYNIVGGGRVYLDMTVRDSVAPMRGAMKHLAEDFKKHERMLEQHILKFEALQESVGNLRVRVAEKCRDD